MKKQLVGLMMFVMMLVTPIAVAGCGSTWWANFASNPVAQVQSFELGAQVALNGAQVAFNILLPQLPAADQVVAQKDFNLAVTSVNHALQVLNDAVTAAVDAKQPNPDFSGVISAVTDAINQVIAIVDQYTGKAPVAVAALPGLADAKLGAQHLARWSAKK